jgi:hypothetical protein
MGKVFYYNAEGHKYIKREGEPGNYTYIYRQPKEEGAEKGTKPEGENKEINYPKKLKDMSPKQKTESQKFFDKLPDKELSKRLDVIKRQKKQAIDRLDSLYPKGDYKKQDFLKRPVIKGEAVRYMEGLDDLDIIEDQIIKARQKKFKE